MATVLLLEDVTVTVTVTVTEVRGMMMMMMIVKNFSRREDCINTIRSETNTKAREQGSKAQNEDR